MPNRPPRICSHPGCQATTHSRYCEKHKSEADQHYNRYQRDRTAQTFYESGAWRKLRQMKLRESPFCELCRTGGTLVKATVVDHIIPIKQGGAPLDLENLQSLCNSCHSRKSTQEGSRFGH
jgi:5-methylcytosine-specific restriction protein A